MKKLYTIVFLVAFLSFPLHAGAIKNVICNSDFVIDQPIITGSQTAVCNGDTVQLTTAAATGTITWYDNAGATGTPLGSGLSFTTPALTVTKTFYAKITDGTETAVSNGYTITVNPLPTISGASSVCMGSTLQLTSSGSPSASGPWTSSNIAVATVNNSGLVSPEMPGTTVLTYKNNNGCEDTITITVHAKPIAAFSSPGAVNCATQSIAFTNTSSGSNLTYLWNFGNPDSGTANTSTAQNPSHVFIPSPGNGTQSFTVALTVTNTVTQCQDVETHQVTVKQLPDPLLAGTGSSIFNNFPTFKVCQNSPSPFTFGNASTTVGTNTNYNIDWGDNSTPFNSTSFSVPVSHTYQVGLYTLTYTVEGQNGCSVTKIYKVFVGSNPAVSLGNPGNTDICLTGNPAADTLVFPINNTENNAPGTTYTITFSDDPQNPVIYNHPPPPSVPHTYFATSCGSNVGTFQNSFSATIVARNPCSQSQVSVVPIYISTKPEADFNVPNSIICTNVTTCFTDITDDSNSIDASDGSCTNNAPIIWSITPSTGYTITSGSLGFLLDPNDSSSWISGSPSLCPKFTIPGTYIIKLTAGNKCGITTETKTICVEAPLAPTFTKSVTEGCTPLTVNTTNTTALINQCDSPTYSWNITFSDTNCAGITSPTYNYTNGTSASSANPSFNFVTPGTYSLKVAMTNSCGTVQSAIQTIVVWRPPLVTINGVPSTLCGGSTIAPTSQVQNCATQSLSYAWTFQGGTPATSTNINPGTISYSTPGTYNVSLAVTNECGTTTESKTITISPTPTVNAVPNQIKCTGELLTAITFDGALAGTTYTWQNSNTAIGLPSSGTGNINSFALQNPSTSILTATITVTPVKDGCTGIPKTFTITVNPQSTVTPINNISICNGASQPLINFTGSSTSAVYNWSNDTPGIGLVAGGTGSIPSFTAINTGTSPIVATIVVTPVVDSCPGAPRTFTITVNPVPSTLNLSNVILCKGEVSSAISFSNNVSGTTYTWSNSNTGVGLGANGIGPVPSFTAVNNTASPLTATVTVTPTANGCSGAAQTFTITVNPSPVTAFSIPAQTICSGDNSTPVTLSSPTPDVQFSWSAIQPAGITGVQTNGTSSIPAQSLFNSTSSTVTITYKATSTTTGNSICAGNEYNYTITVNPAPSITSTITATTCSGVAFSVLPVNSTDGIVPSNTTYTWAAPSPMTGITGLTPGTNQSSIIGTLTNSTNSAVIVTYIVTPKSGNCTGVPFTVEVTVTPTPNVADVDPQTWCNGTATSTIAFSGSVSGTIYEWTNSNPSIGIAGAGTGDISSFTATNNGATPVTATITVTPKVGSCSGPSKTFTITVNPAPVVAFSQSNQTICSGATSSVVNLTSTTPGSTFTWTAQHSAGLSGVIASGTNTIPVQTLTNNTSSPIVVTYTANAATAGVSCPGPVASYTITVNPVPVVGLMQPQIICSGGVFEVIPENEGNNTIPAGTNYTWSAPTGTGFTGGSAQTTPQASISQTLTNITNTTVTATYSVTPRLGSCNGTAFLVEVHIKPAAVIGNQTRAICSGEAFSVEPVNNMPSIIVPSGTTYSWSTPVVTGNLTGGDAGTDEAIISETLANPTNVTQTATYTVTPKADGCDGAPFTITVTVNPKPSIAATLTQTICSGSSFVVSPANSTDGIVPSNTTYTWAAPSAIAGITGLATGTNQNTVTGNLTNTTDADIVVPYMVTPKSGNCTGTPFIVNITVTPTPNVADIVSLVVCNGESTQMVDFTGTITNTDFEWTNSNPAIGLPGTGTDDIPSFTAINDGTAPITAIITVTPKVGDCSGPSKTFTITVNPAPVAAFSESNQTICSGATSSVVNLTSTTPGSTFTWTAQSSAGLTGVVTSGTNTIPAQTLTNTTSSPIVVTYTANAATAGISCPGPDALYTITVNPVPSVTTPQSTVTCSGISFTVLPTDGSGNMIPTGTNYTWSAPTGTGFTGGSAQTTPQASISQTLTNVTNTAVTATYTVTPRLGNCNGATFLVEVQIKPTPVIGNQTRAICSGETFSVEPVNTMPSVIVPSGTTYSWDAPIVTGGMTGGNAGIDAAIISETLVNPTNVAQTATYSVTPKADGCDGAPFIVTVTVNPEPSVSTTLMQTICSGSAFIVSPANSTDGIVPSNTTYTWAAPSAIAGIAGLASGNNQNTITGTLTNTNNADVVVSYTVTPKSGNCTGMPFTVNITVTPTPNVADVVSQTLCNSESTLIVDFTGTVIGTQFEWTNNNPTIGLSASGTGDIPSFTAINNGTTPVVATITITPTIGNCLGQVKTFTITVNPAPAVTFSQSNQIICSGSMSVAVNLTSTTPGSTFAWTATQPAGITGIIANGTGTIPAQTITNTTNAPIVVTYTANAATAGISCPGPDTIYTITVNPVPFVNSALLENVCSETQANIVPDNGGGNNIPAGTTFTWSVPTGTGFTGGSAQTIPQTSINPTLTNITNSPVEATYNVTPYYANCTGIPFTVTITVNPRAVISDNALTICNGGSFSVNPSTMASLLPAGTSYTWNLPTVTGGITGGMAGANETLIVGTLMNPAATPQTATYTITPISPQGNCSGETFSITITVNPEFTIASQVSDFNGFEISTAGGSDGSINITPSGGSGNYTYLWTGPSGFNATTQDISSLPQGVYTLTISDGLCDPITLTFELHEPLPLVLQEVISSHTNVDCFGEATGIIEVAITQVSIAPFDYVIALDNGTVIETINNSTALNYVFDDLLAGVYDIKVTDANGTVKFLNDIIITQPGSALAISGATVSNFNGFSISCNGANNGSIDITVTGGYPAYSYAWTGPNGFTAGTEDISSLIPGIYTLVLTDTTGSCTVTQSYTITEPLPLSITSVVSDFNGFSISCFGGNNGSVNITPAGGTNAYVYQWTGPNSFTASTQDISNLNAGSYQLILSDTNGCIYSTQTYILTQPTALNITESHIDILCFGFATGSIMVSVTGGVAVPQQADGYFYSWTGPNGYTASTKDISDIFAGTYTLTVTDNSGCTAVKQVNVVQNTDVVVTATTTAITCYGANNASITLSVSGGVGPYTAQWDNLATGFFQNNLSAGNYSITVTDSKGCIEIININIPEAPIFTINPVVTQITCNGANDGSINLNLIGGIAPLSLTWSDGSTAGTTRNNLGPGIYTATILDGTPCQIIRSFTIVQPAAMTVGASVTHATDCDNAMSGSINIHVAGGTLPYTYAWLSGETTEDLLNITSGNYSVTVTDANGCSVTKNFEITRQQPLELRVESEVSHDCETEVVKQMNIATASGGVAPFHYTWSTGVATGAFGQMMQTSDNTTVIVTATDAMGCTVNHTFEVDLDRLGSGSFTFDSFANGNYNLYSIYDPVEFTNTSTGDFLEIFWDFGDGTTSSEENPSHTYLREGTYIIQQTVKYAYGCVSTNKLTIVVEKGYEIMMPNGFTPNGDGINDLFNGQHRGLKLIELYIYDTWGSMIYSEKGETLRGWNGTLNGVSSENGNYVYKVIATTFYGHTKEMSGPFTLIK